MSFFGSLFGGSNPSLNSDIGQSQGLASFLNTTGTSDVAASSNFKKGLLSGDWSKISTLLAPQISAIQRRSQQQKQQLGQFGGRSGGTTAAIYKAGDDVNSEVNDLVSGLTGKAADSLGSEGAGLLSEGETALDMNAKFSQQQMDNWRNSILGKGITGAVGAAESFGLGAAGGALPGGPGAAKGGQGALAAFLG